MFIETNHDVEQYEHNVVAGLNPQKTVYMVVSVGVMVIFSAILYFASQLQLVFCIYIAAIPASAVTVLGFYEKDGMSFFVSLKKRRGNRGAITYISTENRESYQASDAADEAVLSEDEFDMAFDRLKKIAGAAVVIAIILVVILFIVLL